MEDTNLQAAVEAMVLASPEPLPARKMVPVLDGVKPSAISGAVAALNDRYATGRSSFRIREVAGGYQFYILPEYVGKVEELLARRRRLRLTRAALEVVAIVAYRQPVTKSEIEHVRGVASDGVIHNLLEKKLVTVTGRARTVGRPLQYGTTPEFLKFFGLSDLADLPKMAEIEEMIAADEGESQTELLLEQIADSGAEKLNIADGTFDPEERKRLDEGETEPASVTGPASTIGLRRRVTLRKVSPSADTERAVAIEETARPAVEEAASESAPDDN
jgi:segregation and condensation protein B